MYVKQKDLLAGLDKRFVKELMGQTEVRSYGTGDVIFREGHHASRFYVLLRGCVKLTVGPEGRVAFTVNHAGEAFGWSSLLGRNLYAASAQCTRETKLLRIDRVKFNMVLDADPANGLILIRRLANMLGHRLHEAYGMIASREETSAALSQGTAQIEEPYAAV